MHWIKIKYILDVDYDCETGEEHCTVLKTDGTTNMANWIQIVSVMCTHHSIFEDVVAELNKLNDENEQLKERNNRQAKQLDNLYTLIEKQDWKTLKGIIQEFQECEEQIQQEWKCYE